MSVLWLLHNFSGWNSGYNNRFLWGINSNNFDIKIDSSGALMQDSNGKYIFNQIELQKIIVTPKNKSGGKEWKK